MIEYITQILMAFLGTLGFSIVFNSKKEVLFTNSIGGALIWISYLITFNFTNNIFVSYMISAIVTGLYSETIARICKTPATTILIPVSVVLIPGSSLYYTMQGLFKNNLEIFTEKGIETVTIATAIALGIIIVSTFVKVVTILFSKSK